MKPSDFQPDEYGNWSAQLPLESGTFCGKTIGITFDRWRTPQPEQPSADDMKLLERILAGLPETLHRARLEFERHEVRIDPSFLEHLDNPHIWIDSDDRKHPDDWTFVVQRNDWPDFGCHIEFRGSEFREIWAGD